MKRIALLLALVLVFSVFATACENGPETSDDSDISAVDVSKEDGKDDTQSKPEVVLLTKTGVEVPEDAKETLVSNGASYIKSAEADAQYPDTYGTELTDTITGVALNNFYDETLSGYTSTVQVDIDLGTVYETLHTFKVAYFTTIGAGISSPSAMTVFASLDGENWERVDVIPRVSSDSGVVTVAVLNNKEYIKAQYIRFNIAKSGSWLFLDEVMVFADVEGDEDNQSFKEAVNATYEQLGAVAAPTDGEPVDRELDKVLVSKGRGYETVGEYDENFADNGEMLTDGITSGYYEGETWVGFKGNQDVTITLNLGTVVKDIAGIEASFYVNTTARIYMPVALKVVAIDNKNNRTELGILYGNSVIQNGDYKFSLPLEKTVQAKYIEITMLATESNIHLLEEISVYAYRDAEEKVLYPDVVFEDDATEWGSGASSYHENLISGKTQQIVADTDPGERYYNENTDATSKLLTDGKKSINTNIHNGIFFKFRLGDARKVIYDLEHISAVDEFRASFTHEETSAVIAPDPVSVYLSVDGKEWYKAGDIKLQGEGNVIRSGELVLEQKIEARYVVFAFKVANWAGCDELEVYGTKSTSGAVSCEEAGLAEKSLFASGRIEPSEDILDGSKDLCLLYHTKNDPDYTVNDLMPYVAYLDEDGVPQDVMFDSFLFLYNNTQFPSGGYPYEKGLMSDWSWTLDELFGEGVHLNALEEAAGNVKSALGLDDDFTYKVTLTIYYPSTDTDNFGDVDGDGVSENFANYEDRIKAIKWYIDECEARFAAADFKNIELSGYYWYHEEIVSKDTGSSQMINDTSDLVHAVGKEFYWIPWYCAPGYSDWADFGFDCAVMQPNYVFDAESPYSKVVGCAKLTELYGMGVEMEICTDALRNELFFKKYMQYVGAGYEYGYMDDCIIMYYQSTFIFRDAAYSTEVMARTIYDVTYHFIKGDLEYTPATLENLSYTAEKNTVYTGSLGFEEEKMREFEVFLAADHGYVTMNSDGTFTYFPETDYTGEVKFSFIYNEYLGWSAPCEVVINVQ